MSDGRNFKRGIATGILILFGLLILIGLKPFINGILGALIAYVIFKPLYQILEKKMRKGLAAFLCILAVIIIILGPLTTLTGLLIGEVTNFVSNNKVIDLVDKIQIAQKLNLTELVNSSGEFVKNLFLSLIGNVTNTAITILIMLFLLFYMFINEKKIKAAVQQITPFNKKNTENLYKELTKVTRSTILSTGAIALLQGFLLSIGFIIFGIPNAALWGFVGFLLSFLPSIGIGLVWIPAGIIMLSLGNTGQGIGILIWGTFLSSIDNFIRPALNKRWGELHPLQTLIGVFIGVPLFGVIGIIIGPLIIGYFFLIWKIYKEEYV